MTKLIRTAAAALAFAGCATLPMAAVATDQPVTNSYTTALTPQFGVGAYQGVLTLHTYPGGVVNGLYRSLDDGSFVDVTGGRSGNDIWLNIGGDSRMHVDGKIKDGQI